MTVGYLHVGPSTHGVTRYGRVLAQAAREHLECEVVDVGVELDEPPDRQVRLLREAARSLSRADVVHVQYNERIWGEPTRVEANVRTFGRHCSAPLVVTLHDVRDGYGLLDIVRRLWAERADSAQRQRAAEGSTEAGGKGALPLRAASHALWKALRFVWHEYRNARATRWLAGRAARTLVCTQEEARRVRPIVDPARLTVVPHFVERRPLTGDPGAAKAALGLAERRVLTVLGYIHRRKGHDLVVEALPHLPDDVVAVFAGRPGRDSPAFAEHLHARAAQLAVADRMRITGYLSEEVLNRYLAATDLAVCPFREASASGSLATWIATGRPILAADLPLFAACNAMAPGAIEIFAPYTPQALARAACDILDRSTSEARAALQHLQEELALPVTARRHARVYREVVSGRREAPAGRSSS